MWGSVVEQTAELPVISYAIAFIMWRHCNDFILADLHEDLGFFQRLTAINRDFPGANVILHKMGAMPKVTVLYHWFLWDMTFR